MTHPATRSFIKSLLTTAFAITLIAGAIAPIALVGGAIAHEQLTATAPVTVAVASSAR